MYSWRLEPTDKLSAGKKSCLSLRELEKQINADLTRMLNIADGQMTVCELVDRYLKAKMGVRGGTKACYVTVQRVLAKEPFGQKKIRAVKTSDAKLFFDKVATRRWKKLQFHSQYTRSIKTCLSDGSG